MTRLYEAQAYGPQGNCFWAQTVEGPIWPKLNGQVEADVAIIGGGFTGLNAALSLAQHGASVVVLEAEHPGWGASGRNGGFCCLGGTMAEDPWLTRKFGAAEPQLWRDTERLAVAHVDSLIAQNSWEVDRHSVGETCLAHSRKGWRSLQDEAESCEAEYGVTPTLIPREALAAEGIGGEWHGGLTVPLGFALNPRKYHKGLSQAAQDAGAALYAQSPVQGLTRVAKGAGKGLDEGWRLTTPQGSVMAKRVLVATNGYSHEDLPDWMRARTLPVQSSVIVTRPLTEAERAAQGWTTRQMAYDTRSLLHYFRLLPDNRFLFGMRGGLHATPASAAKIARKIRQDFARLFPAWSEVEITHDWSGLVCLMAGMTPFVGPVPNQDGLFAAIGFHGNGVAMGSYAGRLAADALLQRRPTAPMPAALGTPPGRWPLGQKRRWLLAPAFAIAETLDL